MDKDMKNLRDEIISENSLTIACGLALLAKSIVYLADSLRKKEIVYVKTPEDDGTRPRIFC
mgnify:CR=1 FL=1